MLYLGYSALLSAMWFVMSGKFEVLSFYEAQDAKDTFRNYWLCGLLDICAPYLRLAQGRLRSVTFLYLFAVLATITIANLDVVDRRALCIFMIPFKNALVWAI